MWSLYFIVIDDSSMTIHVSWIDWLTLENWPNWSKTCRDRLAGNWNLNWPRKSGRKLIPSSKRCSNWGKGIWRARKLIYDSVTVAHALCECRSRLRIRFAPVRNEQLIHGALFPSQIGLLLVPVEKFRFFSNLIASREYT